VPQFKIENSLFEPVTIEVEGGRTFQSVPLSPFLIREISKLEEQRKAKTMDDMAAISQQIALIFGVDLKEVETIDVRILVQAIEYATDAINGGKAGQLAKIPIPPEPPSGVVDEVTAEKNGLKPGDAVSP
jgi:hypothetical protein